MSDYHVLTGDRYGNKFRIAYHIPLPDQNNRAGVSYRTAVVNSGLGGTTSLTEGTGAGQISAAEKAQIEAGERVEIVEDFATNPGESAAQAKTRIKARCAVLTAKVQAELAHRLTYYGFAGDV